MAFMERAVFSRAEATSTSWIPSWVNYGINAFGNCDGERIFSGDEAGGGRSSPAEACVRDRPESQRQRGGQTMNPRQHPSGRRAGSPPGISP